VVDDSFFMRQVVSRMIQEYTDLVVVGSARSGQEAVEKNKQLKPDVVTLDVEMPGLDGLSALDAMLTDRPVAVVMLSAHTAYGTETAVRALERGAVECVGKPSGSVSLDIRKVQDELIEKIRQAARVSKRLLGARAPEILSRRPSGVLEPGPRIPALFATAVASSTGGPKALHFLLSKMPDRPKGCFVLVQHMAAGFTAALARRLCESAPFPVKEAESGETLLQGVGYVAPGGRHLVVEKIAGEFRAAFHESPPRLGVKPSADLLLSSVAQSFASKSMGVVLTGMGRDDAKGLLEMRGAGAETFAQDESTSVVYGMPRAAFECGAVDHVMPLEALATALRERLGPSGA
jgi:two-component system chemotaxis response regulator CheB